MDKKILFIFSIALLMSQNIFATWDFTSWLTTGLRRSMEQMQESIGKLQQEVSNMSLFKSSTIKRGYDESKNHYYVTRISLNL